MTRVWLFLVAVAAILGFAAIILVALPRVVLIRLEPPEALEPYTESEARGRQVYIANGCVYCHSQQVRDASFTTDAMRGWGDRASAPVDYIFDAPALLGTMRTGPDLVNVGARLPDPDWHLIHLYDPRALVEWSIMPAFPFMFQEKDPADVRPDDRVVPIAGPRAPAGRVVVAKPDALALVDYLLSLRRLYPVPNAAGTGPGTAPSAGDAVLPEASATDSPGAHSVP